MLGLSGSISEDTKSVLKSSLGIVTIFEYNVDQAVKDKIIANYEIKIVTLPLDNSDKYILSGTKDKSFKVTEEANYKYFNKRFYQISKQIEACKISRDQGGVEKNTKYLEFIIGQRTRAIYGYKSKIELVKKLLGTIDSKVLVFTGLTANEICKHKYDSKQGENNLELFKKGKILQMQVVEKVSMGQTILDLHFGVFHQVKSNGQAMLQKALRMCNYESGKTAVIYIVCYENTQDEKWVNKAITMLDPNKITYLHYKNI